MSELRIVLMPSAYAPAVGGVEVLTARLANQLRERGHAVEVWAPRSAGDDLPEREVINGISVRRFVFALPRANLGTVLRTPFAAARTLGALRCSVREFSPTHLHVQCFSSNGAYATALSLLTGTPLIVTLQGETVMDDHDIYDRSASLRTALRWGLRRAHRVTGCSQFTLNDAHARFGLDPAKASVIFNGVDLDETAPIRVQLPYERYVFAMGRVVHKKGFDLLIDAFARVHARVPDVGLVIGGSGAQLPELRHQVERLGLAQAVHFPGQLDRGQVAAVMGGATVFAMPSRLEPFGIVVLEAWRAGVPVIATSHGGPPEFVGQRGRGLVIPPEDTAAMSAALIELLENPSLGFDLTRCAIRDLPDFTWGCVSQEYEQVYS